VQHDRLKERLINHYRDGAKAGSLHGRLPQAKQLRTLFETALEQQEKKALILISGHSGTGKTSLFLQFRQELRQRRDKKVIVLQGKFDQYQQSQDTIMSAFAQIQEIVEIDSTLKYRIEQAVGRDANLLEEFFPGLVSALRVPVVSEQEETLEEFENVAAIKARKRATFLKFVGAICNRQTPMLLFIDDLQWSSSADFDLLGSILLEERIEGLVVIGACREVATDHRLSIFLQTMSS